MIHPAPHLHEDRLFDCYLAERQREQLDPRVAEHLADCGACAARYAEMAGLMDELRTDAQAGADAVFTPERLRAQQQHIARRLEHVGRAARVISFPHHGTSERYETRSRRVSRFVMAAAAAGLFIGVALGASFRWELRQRPTENQTAALQPAPARPSLLAPIVASEVTPPADVAADEAFWSELELMLDRPGTRELQPFDALTPRVRDVSYR